MIAPNYTYRARVTNVVDGDTLDCEIQLGFYVAATHRLRLLRVDTAELNSRDPLERAKALEAKQFLIEQVLNRVAVIQTFKADSFGRFLAEVYYEIDGVQLNLNDELLKAGLAKEWGK